LLPILLRKVHFCMHDWHAALFWLCHFFRSNEYNDGHQCLWQGLFLVLVPMIVYIAKRLVIFVPKFTEKSPFLNPWLLHGTLSAIIFPSNKYNNGHPCLRQGLLVVIIPMRFTRNSTVVFVEMVYASKLLLKRLLSRLCADVNNTSHDSCGIMCLIYANTVHWGYQIVEQCNCSMQMVSVEHRDSHHCFGGTMSHELKSV
jgi:hypothetical protein